MKSQTINYDDWEVYVEVFKANHYNIRFYHKDALDSLAYGEYHYSSRISAPLCYSRPYCGRCLEPIPNNLITLSRLIATKLRMEGE